MIHERIMAQGSFELNFTPEAPLSLYGQLTRFGHVVITPQRIDPRIIGDAGALSVARYSGVLLKREITNDGMLKMSGAGMTWWLGDPENKGDNYEVPKTLSASTLSSALTTLLPSAITSGTVTNGSLGTYTGEFVFVTPLQAIRTVAVALGAEFRVNPDGTIDAGANSDVFNITNPEVVVVRRRTGSDPVYKGVFTRSMSSVVDAEPYATRVVLVHETSTGGRSVVDSLNRSGLTEYDMHGNIIDRSLVIQGFADTTVSTATYLTSTLNSHADIQNQSISTDQWEISGGSWNVGDAFHCYDPPAFVDMDNQINFRGDVIHPVILRLLGASWPVRRGMGIYFRPPSSSVTGADYVDLSDYISYEDGDSRNSNG